MESSGSDALKASLARGSRSQSLVIDPGLWGPVESLVSARWAQLPEMVRAG